MADLSHIKRIDVVREPGPYKMDEVVLFNSNHITAKEAMWCARAEQYNPDVLVITKEQYIQLFRNGVEEEEGEEE